MKIAIFGLGYVGLTSAACLLKQGHTVFGIDPSPKKISSLAIGNCPIFEPGVEELLQQGNQDNRFLVSQKINEEFCDVELAFVCVGTPSSESGSHNMGFIVEVSRQIAESWDFDAGRKLTVCYRSTVVPGTMEKLVQPIFSAHGKDGLIEVIYNPEFLRESTAIEDYFSPAKIVVGTQTGERSMILEQIYKGIDAPFFSVKFGEAEIVKLVDNTFHALKTTFANEVGRVCNASGLDSSVIHEMFVSDTKLNISKKYLRPGAAFGGSCLPKDVRAFSSLAGRRHVQSPLVDAIIRSNDVHKSYCFTMATNNLANGARVLINGLSFKANTDDLRESPFVDLVGHLIEAGFEVSVYDPNIDIRSLTGQNLTFALQCLPELESLLVSYEEASSVKFDRLIDVRGSVLPEMKRNCDSIISIAELRNVTLTTVEV